jgi:hypothetical protein
MALMADGKTHISQQISVYTSGRFYAIDNATPRAPLLLPALSMLLLFTRIITITLLHPRYVLVAEYADVPVPFAIWGECSVTACF